MKNLGTIRKRISAANPRAIDNSDWRQAAVAMLLHLDDNKGLQVLMIERSMNEKDPWSGHLALPGGRVESEDNHPREAAERECMEEIGVGLDNAEFLGQLDDIEADGFPMSISCYVYALTERPVCILQESEVADAFWFPIFCMEDPNRQIEIDYPGEDNNYRFPAIKVPGKSQPLWGITYKLLQSFRTVLTD